MLTPEDIEQKTFSTALRGYDLNEVDDFLDEIMSTLRDLQEQLDAARAGGGAGAGGGGEAAAATIGVDEAAVGRALIAAQEAADRITAEAREEAERIRTEARSDADSWTSERDNMRAEAEREMADLSSRVALVRRELAVLATGVADSLDKMDSVIGDAVPAEEADASVPARHAAPVAEAAGTDDDDISWDTPSDDESPLDESPEDPDGDDSLDEINEGSLSEDDEDGSDDSPDGAIEDDDSDTDDDGSDKGSGDEDEGFGRY